MKIQVVLEALTGSFDTDLDRSASKAEKRLNKMAETFDRHFRRAVGVAAGAGVALAAFVDRSTAAISAFQQMAEQAGDTAENIASLKLAADVSGTAMEEVVAASIKLTKNMAEVKKATDPVVEALAALGLSFKDFKKLSPVEQVDAVAKAMQRFEDSAGKTAVAIALFGKSGATLLPFLNDLGGEVGRVTRFTQEQIETAERWEKQAARTKSELAALSQVLGYDIRVAMDPAITETLKFVKGLSDAEVAGSKLKRSSLQEWFADLGVGLAIVAESATFLVRLLEAIGASFTAVAADVEFVFEAGTEILKGRGASADKLKAALDERNESVRQANVVWKNLWDANFTALSDSIRKANAAARNGAFWYATSGGPMEPEAPPRAPLTFGGPDEATTVGRYADMNEKDQKAVDDYVEGWQQRVEAQRDAEEQMEGLTEELYADMDEKERAAVDASVIAWNDRVDAQQEAEAEMLTDMTIFWEQAARNMQDTLAEFLFEPFKDGVDGMLEDFTTMLRRMAAQIVAARLFNQIGNWGTANSNAGGWTEFFATIAAAFDQNKRASGGPVAGGVPYLVGEEGPELFVPRDSGSIVPAGAWGGGGTEVNVFTLPGQGADVSKTRSSSGREVVNVMIREVASDIERGGPISGAISRTFGQRRTGRGS